MRLTPLKIRILMDCHFLSGAFEGPQAPAYVKALEEFLIEGVIRRIPSSIPFGKGRFQTTEKGAAWVEKLCAVPIPVAQWV